MLGRPLRKRTLSRGSAEPIASSVRCGSVVEALYMQGGGEGPRNRASLRVPASRCSCPSALPEGAATLFKADIAGARYVPGSDARIAQHYRLAR
jgi:hypothetical protein